MGKKRRKQENKKNETETLPNIGQRKPAMTWDAATKYKLLLEINNAIVKETTRSGLFNRLAVEISRIFPFDRFSINLYNPETESLRYFAAAKGISPAGISEGERPVTKGAIAQEVIRSRRPLIIPDLGTHTFWESVRAMKTAGLNATLAYPLIIREKVLGSIHFSFVQCPPNLEELTDFIEDLSRQVAVAVDNMLAYTQLQSVNDHLKMQKDYLLSQNEDHTDFFCADPKMQSILEQVQRVAASDVAVLVTGETGTGKDHIARRIHHLSPRREALFVKVNCPALTPTLFESELFGHARGAFTGADRRRVGRFEMADGGTIFLDEIGELAPSLQAKLLNVLQDRSFERVGENRTIKVNFRLVSATNQDMEKALVEGRIRQDLYYRLNTFSIHIPPLRERREEIPLLVERLTAAQARKTHQAEPAYTPSCMEAMRRYPWPGNVRELKNLVKRLVIMHPGKVITPGDIEGFLHKSEPEPVRKLMRLAEMERRYIQQALEYTHGVVGGPDGAAALLGLPRQTLQYRIKKHGLNPTPRRSP
ncbi:MAG: sigma-54-dependent Fis family transcriptional regulator [Deltaproteobacteria bacterium]|nr:sigma-54-dependent Fis family transcriptional regulator [Deltaproteobacteria bacterium]MBW2132368.1 sigma-54-dependent Fis family transcriptional regulator [Deltaproteobacteria bacterium]